MADRSTFWMMFSGVVGFSLFLIANFTDFFEGLDIAAGSLQLLANLFVFICYSRAYRVSVGFKQFVALIGSVVPIALAITTTVHVLLPYVLN